MAFTVWSERFAIADTPGTVMVYTVPEGYRAVVRHISLVNSAQTGSATSVRIHGKLIFFRVPAASTSEQVELRHPVYQRQTIKAQVNLSGSVLTVSGYLFRDSTNATGPPGGNTTEPAVDLEVLPA